MSDASPILKKLENLSVHEIHTKLEKIKASAFREEMLDIALTMALMNLTAIEEHLAFTGAKTKKNSYYEFIKSIQGAKQTLLNALHLMSASQAVAERFLAGSMRLMEVGTKQFCLKNQPIAAQFFQNAYELFLLFEALRHEVIKPRQVKQFDATFLEELDRYLADFVGPEINVKDQRNESIIASQPEKVKIQDLHTFIEQVDSMKKQHQLDLSSDQDLSLGVMNLIVIEEDLFLLGAKTNHHFYYETLCKAREIRKALLQKLITHHEGEVWCTSKHLLSASMRMMQAGFQESRLDGDRAFRWFQMAYELYSLFWGINLGIIKATNEKRGESLIDKLGALVKKAVNCCIE